MNNRGNWMQTYSGKAMFPMDPRPEEIDIDDIIHALSLQCRYNGMCEQFYSISQHSVHCASHVLFMHGDATQAKCALFHDAAEAYVGDVVRPVKQHLSNFKEIEDRVLEVIFKKFDLPWPMTAAVKEADEVLLATEARDLMKKPPMAWTLSHAPIPTRIYTWSPAFSESSFRFMFETLSDEGKAKEYARLIGSSYRSVILHQSSFTDHPDL